MTGFAENLARIGIMLLISAGISIYYFFRHDYITKHGHLSEAQNNLDFIDIDNRIRKILRAIIANFGCPPSPLIEKNLVPTRLTAICKHYGLPRTLVVSMRIGDTGGPPAIIQSLNRNNYIIIIHPSYKYNNSAQSALLAHECAHIWADHFLGKPSDIKDLERDVDVLAVLLGAGSLILGGMRQTADYFSDGISVKTETLGYLTLAEYAYVMAAYVHFLDVDTYDMLEHLPPVSLRAYQTYCECFNDSPQCIQLSKSYLIFECNYCLKKLRTLRKNDRIVIAVCPICRTEFSIKTSRLSTKKFAQRFLKVSRAASPFNAPFVK